MDKKSTVELLTNINDNIIKEILMVESLLKAIFENCLSKECNSQYYNKENFTQKLSEERNTYINLLSLSIEKLKKIQDYNNKIENFIILSTENRINNKNLKKNI